MENESLNSTEVLQEKNIANKKQDQIKILLIEDNEEERISLKAALESENIFVEAVGNAADAENVIHFYIFDIAIIDYKLPDLDGVTLIGKLKNVIPDIVSLIVTAHNSVEVAIESLKMGSYDYILKPIDISKLKKIILKIVEEKELFYKSKTKLIECQAKNQIQYLFNDEQISIVTAPNPDILVYDEKKFKLFDKVKKIIKVVKNFYWGS